MERGYTFHILLGSSSEIRKAGLSPRQSLQTQVRVTFPWVSDFKVVMSLGLTLHWLQLGHSQTEREAGKWSFTCQEFHY